MPAPRVFPREPKSLLQANITIDHRSQITEKVEKEVVLVVVAALGEHLFVVLAGARVTSDQPSPVAAEI